MKYGKPTYTYPVVIVFNQKKDIHVFIIHSESDLGEMALSVLSDRYKISFYDEENMKKAKSILDTKNGVLAFEFLYSRSVYENEEMNEYFPEKWK